jgi:hypothetical protein
MLDLITNTLGHLWAWPPSTLTLVCPVGPTGVAASAPGFYDPVSVAAAYRLTAFASLAVVVLGVLGCYTLLNGNSLGSRFVKRYWMWWFGVGFACAGVVWGVLGTAETVAMANSCETNPGPFPVALPALTIANRAAAGFIWGMLSFYLLSFLSTRSLGTIAHPANGFFHNRGCPVPRLKA